jgi:hypothetical protein
MLTLCTSLFSQDAVYTGRESRLKNLLVTTFVGGGHAHPFRFTAANWAKNELSVKYGWNVTVTDDPSDFTPQNLSRYQVIWFSNTSRFDMAFNSAQQNALKDWFENSGKVGVVGNHGTTETYRNWPWADTTLLVGTYTALATPQVATVASDPESEAITVDNGDGQEIPFMQGMEVSQVYDEVFGWDENQRGTAGLKVLAVADESSYDGGGKMGGDHPLLWVREFDSGARVFMSGTGHMNEFRDFRNEEFVKTQFERALLWAGNYDSTWDIPGCMDTAALNHNPDATVEKDPSDCEYPVSIGPSGRVDDGWITIDDGVISLTVNHPSPYCVEILNVSGKKIFQITQQNEKTSSIYWPKQPGIYWILIKQEGLIRQKKVLVR